MICPKCKRDISNIPGYLKRCPYCGQEIENVNKAEWENKKIDSQFHNSSKSGKIIIVGVVLTMIIGIFILSGYGMKFSEIIGVESNIKSNETGALPITNVTYNNKAKVPNTAELPENGKIFYESDREQICPFNVTENGGKAYYMKMINIHTNEVEKVFFVRPNSTAEIFMPTGDFQIKVAFGTEWYGPLDLFGIYTIYSKMDQTLSFVKSETGVSGYTLILNAVVNGNMTSTQINENDFK